MADAATARLEIGKVIQRTFSAIGANAVSFAILAAVLAGLPSVLISIGMVTYIGSVGLSDPSTIFVPTMLGSLAAIVPAYILIGALTHGSVVTFNGGKASLGECFATGLRNAFPLIAVGILSILGFMAGFLLLVVPGIFLALMWSVAAPALVVDKSGIFGSFSRSAELTKGHRWKIFFLYVIYFLLSMIIQALITFPFGGLLATQSISLGMGSLLGYVIMMIYSVINGVIAAAGTAALYYELRTGKEGTAASDLASVFD